MLEIILLWGFLLEEGRLWDTRVMRGLMGAVWWVCAERRTVRFVEGGSRGVVMVDMLGRGVLAPGLELKFWRAVVSEGSCLGEVR